MDAWRLSIWSEGTYRRAATSHLGTGGRHCAAVAAATAAAAAVAAAAAAAAVAAVAAAAADDQATYTCNSCVY